MTVALLIVLASMAAVVMASLVGARAVGRRRRRTRGPGVAVESCPECAAPRTDSRMLRCWMCGAARRGR